MYLPSKQTLRRYGLTLDEYQAILIRQDGKCPICGKSPDRFHIDHEHVKGWKNMPPDKKRTYVRGLLCWYCNRWYMSRNMTVSKAINMGEYLRDYEARK